MQVKCLCNTIQLNLLYKIILRDSANQRSLLDSQQNKEEGNFILYERSLNKN